ncbi:serine/threonine-protein kinase [Streptomyces melanogenes]|uniref:serine/threonine-protein kinase n=1 Tax=Streptomyces melanogenes TaxID=67326 RepID=UPI00227D7216|nr:serine/threonine-protein kinase [Streptomyces melanogenes]
MSRSGDTLSPLGPEDPRETAGYQLLARIGEGGMGTVYLSHTRGGQPVALKVIRREYGQDADFRRRFEQEVQAARRVQGYHIVPVVDHDTSGAQPWLATQYVPGLSLHDALTSFGPLPLAAVFQLVGCAAQALTAVHAAGVIHRDLKPSNVLLGSGGPYVIDFGIARAADATQLTASGGMIGTPQYMSPEHALGEQLTPATDVFSLGLIAAVAATGRHPYGDGGAITVAAQIANSAHRPPDLSGYPAELRPLLECTLAADPAQRITPADLAPLCEQASGRGLRDFTGWLPDAVAAEIARSEQAAAAPPKPTPAQPPLPPTAAPAMPPAPPQSAPQAPQAPPTVPPTAQPTPAPQTGAVPGYGTAAYGAPSPYDTGYGSAGYGTAPQPAVTHPQAHAQAPAPAPSTSQKKPKRRIRTVLMAAALVVAVGAGAAAAVWFTKGKKDDDAEAKGGTTQSPAAKNPPKESPSADSTPSAGASDDTALPANVTYTVVFQDKPITVRTPESLSTTQIDFDVPAVDPTGKLAYDNTEFEARDDRLDFKQALGKANGTTPELCREGALQNPLPKSATAQMLNDDHLIKAGDTMCSVTTKGNLAMWKITKVTPSTDKDIPAFEGTVTLWKATR